LKKIVDQEMFHQTRYHRQARDRGILCVCGVHGEEAGREGMGKKGIHFMGNTYTCAYK
jgi:hypothetical protein